MCAKLMNLENFPVFFFVNSKEFPVEAVKLLGLLLVQSIESSVTQRET